MSHYKLAFLGFGNVGKALADLLRSRVSPQMVGIDSPLYGVDGTTSILQIESDVLGKLSLIGEDPSPHTTAYGLLADFLNAVR